MTHQTKGLLFSAATGLLALLFASSPSVFAVDYFWDVATGDWKLDSNWDQGFSPLAQYEEVGVINNGGTATLNSAAPDAAGLRIGDAVGESGTFRVLSGGAINFVDSTGEPQGIANIGTGGTGVLEVQGGGMMSATSLDMNVGSNIIIGSGTGSATIGSTGNSWFGGTTTIHGTGHTFTVGADAFLEGSGTYNPILSSSVSNTVMSVTGSASLGGTLQVGFASGYSPALGNSWKLIDAANITGNFANAPGGIVPVTGEHAAVSGAAYRLRTVDGGTNGKILEMSLEGILILQVNRDSGELKILNPIGADVPALDSYTVTSGLGSLLASYKGISGSPAADTGWEKAPMNSMTGLAEFKPTGGFDVSAALTSISLGTGFSKTAVASQGLGVVGEDLVFSYHTAGGELTVGQVEYVGTPFLNDIVLTVNTDTGKATLKNDTISSIEIDGYSILSATGDLAGTGWTGMNATFPSWQQSPSSATALSETNPVAPTILTAGQSVSLGTIGIFSSQDAQDGLSMKFILGNESTYRLATIAFTSGTTLAGDFNGDGKVDGKDFLLWQKNPAIGNLSDWKLNYGAASLAVATSVPEPGTLYLTFLGSTALIAGRRRRILMTKESYGGYRMITRAVTLLTLVTACFGFNLRGEAAATLTGSPTQPTVGTYDQSQLLDDAEIPGGTTPGGGTYNSQAYSDNAGPVGQTFTAPVGKHLYALTAVSVKGAGDAGTGDNGALGINTTWALEISRVDGTNLTALSTVTGIPAPTTAMTTDWLTFSLTGMDVPALDPNGVYAFEIYSSQSYFGIDGTPNDASYAGGTAFNSAGPGRSFAGNTLGNLANHGYDRTFVVQLTAPPMGPGDANNSGTVDINDYNLIKANLEKSVTMFTNGDLDGNSFVDLNDFRRWTSVAPLSALIQAGVAVPEPASATMAGACLLGLLGMRRRTRRNSQADNTTTNLEAPIVGGRRMRSTFTYLALATCLLCVGQSVQAAVTMTKGTVAPTPGTYDQFDLTNTATIPGGTTPGGGTYNSQAFSDNSGPPGQIFTTPASASGSMPAFAVESIWLKGASTTNFGGGVDGAGATWGIRISEVNGTALTPVKSITGIPAVTAITGDEWFTWTFSGGDRQSIQASKQYAFEVYSSAGWLGFGADESDSYAGGTAFNSNGGNRTFNGTTTGNLANHLYDRTFLVGLSPSLLIGPGDVDGDGDTDLTDYMIIKTNFFLQTGATREQGDLTGDGRVLLDDYVLWKNSADASVVAQASAIPEPGSLMLACVGAGLIAGLRRNRRAGTTAC